jgi:hypothetical protein
MACYQFSSCTDMVGSPGPICGNCVQNVKVRLVNAETALKLPGSHEETGGQTRAPSAHHSSSAELELGAVYRVSCTAR